MSEPTPLLVTTHVHPDGDAVSSLLAFGFLCDRLNRQTVSAMADPIPDRLRFLPGMDRVIVTQEQPLPQKYEAAVILDAGSLNRIGNLETCLAPSAKIVNIDHHLSNSHFGHVNILHLEASATSQILFDIFADFGFTPTAEEATCLYTGILTDTGRFRFANTTARALEVASCLVDLGADPALITERIYYEISRDDIQRMNKALETLEVFAGGEVCTLFLASDSQIQDSDALVDLALSIRGVEVALLFSEMADGRIRISLRSKNRVNVSRLAEHFGGGGHFKAAGLRMRGTLESARERLLPAVIEALESRELPVVPA
ncbi:MAG: bifunctional oligoribonuclease/PAP phosphatase NrnA [bacterium]